jgi:tetratricopeptide (TPR) repeat protein
LSSFGVSKTIGYSKINKKLYAIKLLTTKNKTILSKSIRSLSNEVLYKYKSKKRYYLYIVNIKNKKLLNRKLKKYKKIYYRAKITNIFKSKKKKKRKIKRKQRTSRTTQNLGDEYKKAVALYEKEEFEDANIIFYKLYKKHLDNRDMNLYLAKTSMEIEDYDTASAAVERVLIVDENSMDAKLVMGRMFYEKGVYKRAKSLFIDVKINSKNNRQKKIAEEYLNKINTRLNRHKFYINASAGVFNDDNAKNAKNLLYTDIAPSESTIEDSGHRESISVTYIFSASSDTKI